MPDLSSWIVSSLLLTLRISPVFAFAPPFTLVRIPRQVRVLMGLGLAACLVGGGLPNTLFTSVAPGALVVAAARELFIGSIFVLAFQIAFGAIYVAGRTIDIQAGFGLAMLIDPTSRSQTPLVGTLFAYAAGLAFFAMGGHYDLLRLIAASLDAVPLGTASVPGNVERVLALLSTASLISFGVAGGSILILFLTDMAIAVMSRTIPQMNVLLLGFQIKTLLLLVILATSFGVSTALLARMMAVTLSSLLGLF